MGCDGCTDKEKKQAQEKIIEDAKKQAQEKERPMAICKGEGEEFILDAEEAFRTGQIIVDIISHLQ